MTGPCLAVIPARGGSKGLRGKNIRPLGGLPLLVHSLRCAELSPQVDRVVVSTDDAEIADIARLHGGDVPFVRPAELARDDSPMMPVLAHALHEIERLESRRFDTVLLLDPTSPGRTPSDIERAVDLLASDTAADGVIACSQPSFNPFWVGVTVDDGGALTPAFNDAESYTRRQDVPTFYRINGALYLWRRAFVESVSATTSGRQLLLEIPERRAFSIDDLDEFDDAERRLAGGAVQLPWMESDTR